MGSTGLGLAGSIAGDSLTLAWAPLPNTTFHLRIDKCDARVDCYTIHESSLTTAKLSLTNEMFSLCTTYNVHLEAVRGGRASQWDEVHSLSVPAIL